MRGRTGLGVAMLVAAVAIAPPALSAAQLGDTAGAEALERLLPAPPDTDQPADQQPGGSDEAGSDSGQAEAPAPAEAQPAPAAAAAGSGDAQASASATVSIGDNFYSPATVTINVGDTVTWRNDGQAPHSATANDGSFDTGVFTSGQSRSHTFDSGGDFAYFCTVHGQSQSGTVRVQAASGGGGGGSDDGAGGGQDGGSGGSGGGTGGAGGPSEADAVASPDAAGTSTTLPATGLASLGLALIGLALLGSGSLLRRLERLRSPG